MNLGDLKNGEKFTMTDKGFESSIQEYWGIVIGKTVERLTAIRYGTRRFNKETGHVYFDDAGQTPRTALWDSLTQVEQPPAQERKE